MPIRLCGVNRVSKCDTFCVRDCLEGYPACRIYNPCGGGVVTINMHLEGDDAARQGLWLCAPASPGVMVIIHQ